MSLYYEQSRINPITYFYSLKQPISHILITRSTKHLSLHPFSISEILCYNTICSHRLNALYSSNIYEPRCLPRLELLLDMVTFFTDIDDKTGRFPYKIRIGQSTANSARCSSLNMSMMVLLNIYQAYIAIIMIIQHMKVQKSVSPGIISIF